MSRLAEILKQELKAQGLSQQDLAEAVGVTQPSIYKIVSGKTLKPRILPEIAQHLGVSIDYLLGHEEKPQQITEGNPKFERMKALFLQMDEKDLDKGIEYLETLAANSSLKKFRGN